MKYYLTGLKHDYDRKVYENIQIDYENDKFDGKIDKRKYKKLDRLFIIKDNDKYYELFSNIELEYKRVKLHSELYLFNYSFKKVSSAPDFLSLIGEKYRNFIYYEVSEREFLDSLRPYWEDRNIIKNSLEEKRNFLNEINIKRKKENEEKIKEQENRKIDKEIKTYIMKNNH